MPQGNKNSIYNKNQYSSSKFSPLFHFFDRILTFLVKFRPKSVFRRGSSQNCGRNTRGDRNSDKNRENLPKKRKARILSDGIFRDSFPCPTIILIIFTSFFRIFAKFLFLILTRARAREFNKVCAFALAFRFLISCHFSCHIDTLFIIFKSM